MIRFAAHKMGASGGSISQEKKHGVRTLMERRGA